jgi:hypothetical protein
MLVNHTIEPLYIQDQTPLGPLIIQVLVQDTVNLSSRHVRLGQLNSLANEYLTVTKYCTVKSSGAR